MSDKWTEKDVLEYWKQDKSPFEQNQNGQKPAQPGIAEKVNEILERNKGMQ